MQNTNAKYKCKIQMQNTNAKYKYNNTMQQKEYNRGVTPSTQQPTKCIKMYFKDPTFSAANTDSKQSARM